ncbi:MAG: ABC transporter ATP-binding protein [Saprospiraceae bacterium]|nr:ABC transporter ATP-binding protein [Lewinella sp.]
MINVDNLSFSYPKRTALFDGLSLQLQSGSIYGLLGKNGAGKSSLLHILTGLLFPQSGNLNVMGYQPRQRHPELLSDCFFLSEDIFLPNLTVQSYRKLYAPFYPGFDHDLFQQLIREFDLDICSKLPGLSLGQKKKVLLAFGLATNARVLLLDEPTNGLDIPSKKQFRSVLARHMHDNRIIILSTHQIRDLQSLIDTIIILDKGQIVFHESLLDITDRLQFSISHREPGDPLVLYYERVPGGYYCIRHKGLQESLEVDVEILFNAIISDPSAFSHLFNLPTYE